MLITIARAVGGSTVARVRRPDGVVLDLPAYDRKHRVPHDLAHAVTECELGMADGVFGSIAGGGVFSNMRLVSGRPRHDAADRSKRLLAANKAPLGVAEVVSAAIHHAVEHDDPGDVYDNVRRGWGVFRTEPCPWTAEQLAAVVARLAELTVDFEATGKVVLTWPDALTSRVPAPAVAHKRGRRGRI
ncbi:hypothetical protein [Paractinoplanes rishiriensis]|uniref:Uncharacterized protein n=1 Tax=Paractinoplanes rishiriensis TaxID=1050105 RepID=A0A919K0U9_9ACTN|nr:hypothetical protein [Actinoplanes rishiriensis]GIE94556.1 hypothetical protein Ari01nite_20210 [Actinoplanes rishiriensis]